MRRIVKSFVQACDLCQRTKAERQHKRGLLEPLTIPKRKWQSVSMDWVVGLPLVYRHGRDYDAVLVFTDRATKMVHLVPTSKTETAEDTAELFIQNVVRLHGLPRSLHSDRDTRITSHFWQQICRVLDIRARSTTAYHPQANGQAERSNQTMKQLLRIAHADGRSWYDVLPQAEMAMNSAPIAHTEFSPFMLNYGHDPCLIADVFDQAAHEAVDTEEPFIFMERLKAE